MTADMLSDAFMGGLVFCAVMSILIVLDAVVSRVLGPDKDLERPWDPRR